MKQSHAIYMGDDVTLDRIVKLTYTVKRFVTEIYHQEKCCKKSIIMKINLVEGQEIRTSNLQTLHVYSTFNVDDSSQYDSLLKRH